MANPNSSSTPNIVQIVGSIDASGNVTSILSPNGTTYISNASSTPNATGTYPSLNISRALMNAYRTNIGASVNELHMQALETALAPLIASTAWTKIRELWIPLGNDLAGALFKIKYPAGGSAALTNSGLFVGGDYTPVTGLKGDGVGKYLTSSSNPTTLGMTAGNLGMAFHTSGNPSINTAGILCSGTQGGNYFYCGFGANTNVHQYGTSGGALGTLGKASRLNFLNANAGQVTAGAGSLVQASLPVDAGSGNFVPNNTITLFSQATSFYCDGYGTGFALFDGMTSSELDLLSRFFDAVNFKIGRNIFTNPVFVGDSIAAGQGVTTSQRWASLVSVALGSTAAAEVIANRAVSGQTMSLCPFLGNTATVNSNQKLDTPLNIINGTNPVGNLNSMLIESGSIYFIALGINDCSFSGNIVEFELAYRRTMDKLKSIGAPLYSTVLLSLTYGVSTVTNSYMTVALAKAYNVVIAKIASDYGCIFVNVYDLWTASNAGTYLQGDVLHPNVTGHTLIATTVINTVISSLNKLVPIYGALTNTNK